MTDVKDVLEKFKGELEKRTPEEQRKFLRDLGYNLAEEQPMKYKRIKCFSQDISVVNVKFRDTYQRLNKENKEITFTGYSSERRGVA